MLENLLNSPFLTSLALTLLHFMWQGVLVATVLKSALLIFDNNKPQLRYALSALAMLVSLILPIITFIILYRAELSSDSSLTSSLVLNELIQELKQPDSLFNYTELTEKLPLLLPYISVLWLITISFLAGKLLFEISAVNKLPQQGTVAPSDALQARFDKLVKQINLSITPQLLISLKVDVPMAIGWLKPVVLIPASMISGLNNAQLEMLILHELAHIRRHDYLVNFLQTLIEILLFFHPAVLWVSKQMRNEREYCSDDIAVQHCGDAVAYAHTLADTASLCTKSHNHTIPDMAMAASGGDLKQRVIRLVDHHCAPNNNISKWFASATIIFSVLLLSSKQLLTMPLLDIWYNDNPWKQQDKTLMNTRAITDNKRTSNESPNNSLSNTSIAQQLLTPQQVAFQKGAHKPQNLFIQKSPPTSNQLTSVAANEIQTAPVIEVNKDNSKLLNETKNTTSQSNQFNSKLDKLSSVHSNETKKSIESSIASNSKMVNDAFERTTSSNPYQEELAQLATSPEPEVATKRNAINKLHKSEYTDFLEAPLSMNQQNSKTKESSTVDKSNERELKAFVNNELTKSKIIAPVAPIWHNAEQLKSVDPIYPSVAKRKGIEIEVKVDFTIDVDGQIKDIQFARQNKINYFRSSIRSAIKKWRFLPAKVDNKPVESQMSKVFSFSLQS
jgi:TonB family protein